MDKIKKMTLTYVVAMFSLLVWGAFLIISNMQSSIKLELATGDKIKIKCENTDYDLERSSNALYVKNGDTKLLKITFVKETDWCNYISNNRTQNVPPHQTTNNGIFYEFFTGDAQDTFAAWITGTNSGMIVYAQNPAANSIEKIFHSLKFTVAKTSQINSEFYPIVEYIDVSEESDSSEDVGFQELINFDISLDGVDYVFPYDYQVLREQGWKIEDPNIESDGYILGSGVISREITLINESYGTDYDDFVITCKFKNDDNMDKDVVDCKICHLSLDAANGMKMIEQYPKIVVVDKISFGSTEEAVRNVLGEPATIYQNDYCSILTYGTDLTNENKPGQYIQFIVYREYGVVGIDLKWETYEAE